MIALVNEHIVRYSDDQEISCEYCSTRFLQIEIVIENFVRKHGSVVRKENYFSDSSYLGQYNSCCESILIDSDALWELKSSKAHNIGGYPKNCIDGE